MSEFTRALLGMPSGSSIAVSSEECGLFELLAGIGPTSGAYSTANQALYIPFRLSHRLPVAQVGWWNGATVSGNVDMGIYDAAGNRLGHTGSTAQAGVSVLQAVALALTLDPGYYYFGFACDNITATFFRYPVGASSAQALQALQLQVQATAFPLPATATFANPGGPNIPYMALFTESVA
jgi:hypothetical protein